MNLMVFLWCSLIINIAACIEKFISLDVVDDRNPGDDEDIPPQQTLIGECLKSRM
jgi:hypothetical protein